MCSQIKTFFLFYKATLPLDIQLETFLLHLLVPENMPQNSLLFKVVLTKHFLVVRTTLKTFFGQKKETKEYCIKFFKTNYSNKTFSHCFSGATVV